MNGYHFRHKKYLMTPNERQFYSVLSEILGEEYAVFPQIHLSSLVDQHDVGQDWEAAFRHVNGKSVDYVVCNRNTTESLLAIELDDEGHMQEDRHNKDVEKQRILKEAGVVLLRVKDYININSKDLEAKLEEALALRRLP